MNILPLVFNPFGVNTYIVWDTESLQAAVIDPGMSNSDECRKLTDVISAKGLHVVSLINTHLHVDHALGDAFIESHYGVSLSANTDDAFLGRQLESQAAMFHLPIATNPVTITTELKQGDRISLGSESLEVLEVPGHSPGSIALYSSTDGFVITGDALFNGSIGRTDLPGGDFATLIRSIRTHLLPLPDDTIVYPGHGPTSTIGAEKKWNPFLK